MTTVKMIEPLEILVNSQITVSGIGPQDVTYLRLIQLHPEGKYYLLGPQEEGHLDIKITCEEEKRYKVVTLHAYNPKVEVKVIEEAKEENKGFWKRKKEQPEKDFATFEIYFTREDFEHCLNPLWRTNYPHATEHIIPMKNLERK